MVPEDRRVCGAVEFLGFGNTELYFFHNICMYVKGLHFFCPEEKCDSLVSTP